MVTYMDGCWHCISPDFLEDQLTRALDRLGLETIDVLLLHNPEYFLMDASHHRLDDEIETVRTEFYERLTRAFSYLDGAVADGRIGAYGVSSNTCVSPAADRDATSVSRMVEASGGRMSVLQLPYNLFESGALLEPNTSEGTALEAATAHDLGVLVNRPLNAMARFGSRSQRLIRLADPPRPGEPGSEECLRARVLALGEREAALAAAAPGIVPPRVSELLLGVWEEMAYPQAFQTMFRSEILPEAQRGLRALVSTLDSPPDPARLDAIQAYQDELNALVEPLQARAQRQDMSVAQEIRAVIEPHLPVELQEESLSRMAMAFVASTPGVACVLNGMRQPSYVEDALGVLRLPPIADVAAIAQALRR